MTNARTADSGTGAVTVPGRQHHGTAPMTLRPTRHSCAVEGQATTPVLNRAGATVRQWNHLRRCWLIPVQDMLAVIRQAEREGRPVVIEDGAR